MEVHVNPAGFNRQKNLPLHGLAVNHDLAILDRSRIHRRHENM